MNYIRLMTNFWTHRKTMQLFTRIGSDAFWIPPRLWCYAATNQPDGDFEQYTPEGVAAVLQYSGNAQALLEALQASGFMDGMKVHDWDVHNEFHVALHRRAVKAAKARWNPPSNSPSGDRKGKERKGKEQALHKQCTSNAQASGKNEPKNGTKTMLDEQFLEDLQKNPAFLWMSVKHEKAKAEAWLSTKPGRKLTRRFLVNWLNRVERPMELSSAPAPAPAIPINSVAQADKVIQDINAEIERVKNLPGARRLNPLPGESGLTLEALAAVQKLVARREEVQQRKMGVCV